MALQRMGGGVETATVENKNDSQRHGMNMLAALSPSALCHLSMWFCDFSHRVVTWKEQWI